LDPCRKILPASGSVGLIAAPNGKPLRYARKHVRQTITENIPAEKASPAFETGIEVELPEFAVGVILASCDSRILIPPDRR